MAESTRATIKTIKRKDTGYLLGQTDVDTMGCGLMASRREKERITVRTAYREEASGKMANGYNGFEYISFK